MSTVKLGLVQWTSNAIFDGTSGQAIGDVDGDGIPEIAAANGAGKIILMNNQGTPIWSGSVNSPLSYFMYPSIADMDNDGLAEIIAGNTIFNHDGTIAGVGPHGVGACPNQSSSSFLEGSVAVPVDIDGDGQLEVLVGNAAYEKDGSVVWYNGTADGIPAVARHGWRWPS